MDLQTLTFLVVGATFTLYIGIAFWARASTTGEFYVAGKGIHPIANGMATAADWMSAASFISMAVAAVLDAPHSSDVVLNRIDDISFSARRLRHRA